MAKYWPPARVFYLQWDRKTKSSKRSATTKEVRSEERRRTLDAKAPKSPYELVFSKAMQSHATVIYVKGCYLLDGSGVELLQITLNLPHG